MKEYTTIQNTKASALCKQELTKENEQMRLDAGRFYHEKFKIKTPQ